MNKTNSADLNNFSNFHSLYFSVGNTLMLANLFKKQWKVPTRCKVRGFYDNSKLFFLFQGDSGGPLAEERTDEGGNPKWYVVGVVKAGHRCGEGGAPSYYMRVSEFLGWITETAIKLSRR